MVGGVVHLSWSRAKHWEQEAVFFFFYLGHARSDGGSGDEDHVGSKLSRPEDLQRLWRRDGETCYWGRTIHRKKIHHLYSYWRPAHF